ncbi:hypothetical protein M0R45_032096 [Rubus argutus]|uniref:Uncharacterized protein n=1 Tax=Rubus argutus TaxID=59490 RepID=A0AAW1WFI3_RUBAR
MPDIYLGSKEDVGEIKISGHHLKSLIFCGHVCDHKIINLDAPNLVRYQREDDEIPSSFRLNSVKLEWVNFILCGAHLNSQWFLKLREYVGKFTACDRLRFRMYHQQPCRTYLHLIQGQDQIGQYMSI